MNILLRSFFQRVRMVHRALFSLSPTERYTVGLLAFVAFASISAIGVQYYLSHTKPVPADGGTYEEAAVGGPRFINPVLSNASDVDRDISRLLYAGLMRYDEKGNLVPDLAESYKVENEGKRYRFVLRENLAWDDGATLSADDVLFTIRVIQDQKYGSPLRANWLGVITSQADERTVVFDLPTAYVPFLENTTLGILPRHVWENVPPQSFLLAEANLKPVGSGPYKFEKFQKDLSGTVRTYELVRNDRAWDVKPRLDRIVFHFFEAQEDAVRAYNGRIVDGVSGIDATRRPALAVAQETAFIEFRLPRYFALFFNDDKSDVSKSLRVRQALAHATDQHALIEGVLGGAAEVADSPIPSFMPAYNKDTQRFSFDPDKARALLDQEGWKDSDGDGIRDKTPKASTESPQKLEFTLMTVSRTELVRVAEAIARQWADVGVKLNVESREIGDLQQNTIIPRNYQMLLFGQLLSMEPDPFSFWHSSQIKDPGLNLALYANKDVDRLLEEARREQNADTRTAKLRDFQRILANDVPAIFLYDPSYTFIVRKNIKGIEGGVLADPSWRFGQVTHWYINTKRTWQ